MRIFILGAGAIGSLFGGYLARENDVTLICREGHANAVNEAGLNITGLSDMQVRPKAVTSAEGLEPPEILFLTVKAYDIEAALGGIRKLLAPETTLVSLQNGLGNVEILERAFPDANLVAGITSQGAILRSPGLVEHTGRSYTMVGRGNAAAVAELLTASGLETSVSEDILAEIWYKAIVNAVINPLATLLKARNGIILERPELAGVIDSIICEAVEVARVKGILLDEETAIRKAMLVAKETANNACSMRLDVERGRRTEIMQMNGAIAAFGREFGISTPANALITALIHSLEPKA
ncbi:MAG: 2-dehydropantoate 2-reductase [Thermoplasmata archaeon]